MRSGKLARRIQLDFRKRRMQQFVRAFGLKSGHKLIDIGGTPGNWSLIEVQPEILLVNIDEDVWERGRIRKVKGDATRLEFDDNSFDIAYSNSVIEHVGGWPEITAFAREIRRVAPQYYVQTPNKWFPLEVHFHMLFLHWLPFGIARHLVRYLSLFGWTMHPSQARIDEKLRNINLLSEAQVKELFPDARIFRERFLGMTKSFVAVKTLNSQTA